VLAAQVSEELRLQHQQSVKEEQDRAAAAAYQMQMMQQQQQQYALSAMPSLGSIDEEGQEADQLVTKLE
jgi:hypothetical protein